jgi:hypothetical protein
MAGNNVKAVPLTSFNSAGFTGGYDVINAAGLPNSCFQISITNDSNVDIIVSLDGVTNSDFIRTGSTLELPVQASARGPGYVANFRKGTKIYALSAVPGIGFIYLAGYYQ